MPTKEQYDILIVGAGFFGLCIAEYFGKLGKKVLLCEKQSECMTRASYVNQARVHNGYHYPRSLLTALRSRVSYPTFIKDFEECIVSNFKKYYAIGKILGKVTSKQYDEFCTRIGAVHEEAPKHITKLFNPHYIEKVFAVTECAFDSYILRDLMIKRIKEANVELLLNTTVTKIKNGKLFDVTLLENNNLYNVKAIHVFNCTYSNLNFINYNSNIELIPLKYEMTEMALVTIPEELQGGAFTVMCGPFFSLMPFPTRNCYSLSHVRYTPHYEWYDNVNANNYISPLNIYDLDQKQTAFKEMQLDSQRYLPAISKCNYIDSIWEVKTVLPLSEISDSRPILFKMNYIYKNYHCIMGGKLDNVYDVITIINNNKDLFL